MIPNFFSKQKIPNKIPKDFELKINNFSKGCEKEEFLRESFDFVAKGWGGSRFNLFWKFFRLFEKDIFEILNSKGYLHCTTMNFLIRVMGVKSGLFKDEDFELVWTNSWYIAPHQYLRVRIGKDKYLNVDVWNYQFGIDFGDFGSGFDSLKVKPVR